MIPRAGHFPRVARELSALLSAEGLRLFGVARVPSDVAGRATGDVEPESLGESPGPDADRAAAEYRSWIEAGLHGEMGYLAKHAQLKFSPQRVLPGCRSVVVVGCNYYQRGGDSRNSNVDPGPTPGLVATGRVARYAWGRDYHNALGKRLARIVKQLRARHPDDAFRGFVDASPLSERFFAEHAGIAYTARNTLSISSAYGSWFFLGEILTTAPFEPTPTRDRPHGACPSGCFRCGTACPTGALYDHYRIDARRCISYLTIEYRGSIPEELREPMGEWVFGCDLCQEVCPLNVRAVETEMEDFTRRRAGERLRLADLLSIRDDNEYRRRFEGTPLMRPGRDAMVRNACVAAGNTGGPQLIPALTVLSNDHSAIVREHARWAFERIALRERP